MSGTWIPPTKPIFAVFVSSPASAPARKLPSFSLNTTARTLGAVIGLPAAAGSGVSRSRNFAFGGRARDAEARVLLVLRLGQRLVAARGVAQARRHGLEAAQGAVVERLVAAAAHVEREADGVGGPLLLAGRQRECGEREAEREDIWGTNHGRALSPRLR